jgi:hypothetical protein
MKPVREAKARFRAIVPLMMMMMEGQEGDEIVHLLQTKFERKLGRKYISQ